LQVANDQLRRISRQRRLGSKSKRGNNAESHQHDGECDSRGTESLKERGAALR
jgi:hypothetical protein